MATLANLSCRDITLPRKKKGGSAATPPKSGWAAVAREHKLISFMTSLLQKPGAAKDKELLLQLVMLVGALAEDDSMAEPLANSNLIAQLADLLTSK